MGAEGVMQASIALGGRQGSGIQSSQSCRNCSFCIKEEILTKNVGSPEGQYGKYEFILQTSEQEKLFTYRILSLGGVVVYMCL